MANYKAYPEYKDSGVEWLGRVPKHWSANPLKFLCTFNDQVIPESAGQDYEIEYVDIGSVNSSQGITKTETMLLSKAPSRARRLVKDGDVIISTVRTYLEAISPIINPPDNMVVSTGFAVIRPSIGLNHAFAAYCLRASGFIKEVVARSVGVSYPAINASDLVNIPVPNMPLTEQLRIANFLDHETAKIDNLIEKQQQLIELLKEKRQAVISHAVTKGLNPDVPMKNSGVEWLGDVPEHWKLIKFSHCVSIRSGQVDPRKFPYCDYWLIAPNHIVSGEGRIINLETAKDQGADSGKYLCRTGEVIYSKIRPALVKTCLSPSDTVLCSADMYPMTSYNGLTNNFLLLYLLSDVFTRFAVNQADRVAMPKINRESLSDCKIPVPPIDEQEKIYSHAREALEKLDVLLQKSQLTIEFFQERRTALISAAVTGKIDVRDWVAPGTQESEEPQEVSA